MVKAKRKTSKSKKSLDFATMLEQYFDSSVGTTFEKLSNFQKYVPRQNLSKFIAKYELFKQILNVEGAIVECGIRFGGGLMSFAQFSSIFEPVNYTRKIIGFDTFSGFPSISKYELGSENPHAKKGGMKVNSFNDLEKCIELYDNNRFINHIPKIEMIKGDATKTIPKYLKENPQTIVSLLYLDFDIYKPTKTAIENIAPRMPKGSIIAFDELNNKNWKGETQALFETLGIKDLRIKRFNFESYLSYAVME